MHKFSRYMSLMVFLSSLLMVLCESSSAWGQTIHVVLAADRDTRAKLGNAVKVDLENMTYLFRSNVPSENLNLIVLEIESMTPDAILKSIEELSVDPDDAIVFYYSGHGAYDAKNKKQFLDLVGRGNLYRETLLTEIQKKSPRLAVLLTDCCNAKVVNVSGVRSGVTATTRTAKSCSDFSPLFENLFVFCKGTADLTSSKQGEYSFIDTTGKDRGSCFTWPLVELLENNKTNEDLHWKEISEKLGVKVQEAFREVLPRGYEGQTKQSVYVYSLPGMTGVELDTLGNPITNTSVPETTTSPKTPRLGLRAINHNGGGVQITEIVSDSPAAQAGIATGEIIIEINGEEIKDESDYSNAIDKSPKTMEMKLKKADLSTRTLSVELGW